MKLLEKVIKNAKKACNFALPFVGGFVIGILYCKEYSNMFNNGNKVDNFTRRRPQTNNFRGERKIKNFSERRNSFNNK